MTWLDSAESVAPPTLDTPPELLADTRAGAPPFDPLARRQPIPRGTWAAGVSYEINDLVTDGSSVFRCVLAHVADATNDTTHATYWQQWISGGTSGPQGWAAEYAVDFTALTTASASGNGSFVVDGKTWTVENFANADAVRVLHGTGLQIDPNAVSSDYFTTVRTAPVISVPILSLIPDYDPTSDWLRLWVELTVTNCDANYEIATVGFTRLPYVAGGASQLTFQWSNGFSSSRFQLPRMFRGTTAYDGPSGTPTTETALGIVLAPMGWEAWYLSGLMSGSSFPSVSGTNHRGMSSARPSPPSSASSPSFASASEIRLEFSAYPANTNNSFSASIKRLRLDRKR